MKVKEIPRSGNIAWSPQHHHPIQLAIGTAARQFDSTFDTDAAILELYQIKMADECQSDYDLEPWKTVECDRRFFKLIWGGDEVIVGGCDSGEIQIYDAKKLMTSITNDDQNKNGGGVEKQATYLVDKQVKHAGGAVQALDFNCFQKNLFASGASESEIFIWDLNNTALPMSPGTKTQPAEDVFCLAWNKQVQHILASTFTTKCVIWDLRKNEPIIKLSDAASRIRWKSTAWHPDVATQLCLASEDDQSPVIQLWDLRFATSPLTTMHHHQRGVLSMAWCDRDSNLLVSCGKDNRLVFWNPNLQQQHQQQNGVGGHFEKTQNFDDVTVMGEIIERQMTFDVQWCPRNPAIVACPNFDGRLSIFSLNGGKMTKKHRTSSKTNEDLLRDSFPGQVAPLSPALTHFSDAEMEMVFNLKMAPKWCKRPVGVKFGFGGKLVSFGHDDDHHQKSPLVYVSQVVTQRHLVEKSEMLEKALADGENYVEFCTKKGEEMTNQHEKFLWHFVKAQFQQNPRTEILDLLGYNIDDVNSKLNEKLLEDAQKNDYIKKETKDSVKFENTKMSPLKIQTGNDTEGTITQALLLNNVEAAVELCLKSKRYADALVIATTGGDELLARTQQKYLEESSGQISFLISTILSEDWNFLIKNCVSSSWKEILAAILTHANDDDLTFYCEQLGNKLEEDGDLKNAQLCYICCGNFEKVCTTWCGGNEESNKKSCLKVDELQELVELVQFLKKALERRGNRVQISGTLADFLSYYASLLAAQGSLETASNYLNDSNEEKMINLRERLHVASGRKHHHHQPGGHHFQGRRNSHRQSFTSPYPTASNLFPGNDFHGNDFHHQNFLDQPKNFSAPSPQVQHPPRPGSVGSTHGSERGGLPSRKYVLDPSVTSNQYGNVMQPPIQQPYAAPSMGTFNNNYNNNNSYYNPPAMQMFTPALAAPPGGGENFSQPPEEVGQPAEMAPSGWNDPPPLHHHKPPKMEKNEMRPLSVDPITHPLYGAAPADPMMGGGGGMAQAQLPFAHNPHAQMYQTASPVAQVQSFHQARHQESNIANSVDVAQEPPQAPPRVESPQVKAKPEIPPEHVRLQIVFEELKDRCYNNATNPQMKRKLDDVGRRLQTMYDLLRENVLAPDTLSSLHRMAHLVQNGDYNGGLQLHTAMVSGSDFAQLASFMPGVKILLQFAKSL